MANANERILRFHAPDKVFHTLNAITWFALLFTGVYVYFCNPSDEAAELTMLWHLILGAEDEMPEHREFRGFVGRVAEIDVHAREEQGKPRDGVQRVEHLIRGMEAKDAFVSISHGWPPS